MKKDRILEKILPSVASLAKLYSDCHHAFKRRNGYSDLEIAQRREALESVLIPLRIEDNIALLHMGGLSVVDIFFRRHKFAEQIAITR